MKLPGAPAPSDGAARSKVVGASSSAPFQPLRGAPPAAPAAPTAAGEPKVTLEREGDHVTRIRIQCACGRVIELECAH